MDKNSHQSKSKDKKWHECKFSQTASISHLMHSHDMIYLLYNTTTTYICYINLKLTKCHLEFQDWDFNFNSILAIILMNLVY